MESGVIHASAPRQHGCLRIGVLHLTNEIIKNLRVVKVDCAADHRERAAFQERDAFGARRPRQRRRGGTFPASGPVPLAEALHLREQRLLALITMIGTLDQLRIRRITSMPSRSGSPRSKRTISGLWEAVSMTAASPVWADKNRYPWAFNVVVIRFKTGTSSSTARINNLFMQHNLPQRKRKNEHRPMRLLMAKVL